MYIYIFIYLYIFRPGKCPAASCGEQKTKLCVLLKAEMASDWLSSIKKNGCQLK